MLQLETAIVARLRATLPAGWTVKGDATDGGDRRPGAAERIAVVSLGGTGPALGKTTAVVLRPAWTVALASRRGDGTPAAIDAALLAVIGALHHWMPGTVGGLNWEPLEFYQLQVPPPMDDAITGLEITFTTGALYQGQP